MTPASDHPQYTTGTIPFLDGIRAIAVALVFFATTPGFLSASAP